jgi:hypothetical protein
MLKLMTSFCSALLSSSRLVSCHTPHADVMGSSMSHERAGMHTSRVDMYAENSVMNSTDMMIIPMSEMPPPTPVDTIRSRCTLGYLAAAVMPRCERDPKRRILGSPQLVRAAIGSGTQMD